MAKKSKKNSRKKNSLIKFLRELLETSLSVLPPVLGVGFAVFLFLVVRKAVYADTFFQIKQLTVQPPLALPMSERAVLESRFLGKHILKLNLQDVSQSLRGNPEIKHVSVERKFPSSLNLNVEKRQPAAIFKSRGKNKYGVISEDGMILQLMSDLAPGYVIFESLFLEESELKVGYQLRHKAFEEMMDFVREYKENSLAATYPVHRLTFDGQGNISLFFENSPEIRLGRHPSQRINALSKVTHLLEDKESVKISYIDLQFDNVIVKKKG